jgi:hypothetical protein
VLIDPSPDLADDESHGRRSEEGQRCDNPDLEGAQSESQQIDGQQHGNIAAPKSRNARAA